MKSAIRQYKHQKLVTAKNDLTRAGTRDRYNKVRRNIRDRLRQIVQIMTKKFQGCGPTHYDRRPIESTHRPESFIEFN